MKHLMPEAGKISALTLILLIVSPIAFSSPAIDAFDKKDYAAAKVLFEAEDEQPQSSYYLGRIALAHGNLDTAEKELAAAVEVEPNNADYHSWYASVNLRQAANASIFSAPGYAAKARKHYQRALELDPTHIRTMRGLIEFYSNAPAIAGGSNEKALETAEKLQKIDMKEGLIAKVDIYRQQENNKEELATAQILMNKFTESPRALVKAGFTFQGHKQYKKAFGIFERAAGIVYPDEQNSRLGAQYQIGRTAVFSGEYTEQGVAALEAYIVQDIPQSLPDKNWAKLRLASLYQRQGNTSKTRKIVEQIIKDSDDKSLRKQAKNFLKALED